MKNLYLNTGSINEVFSHLETSLNGILNSTDNEFNLTLDSSIGKGTIDGLTFINGITSIQVSVTFSDDTMVSIESPSKSSIIFAYCNQGHFNHSFGVSGHKSALWKHHSGVVTSSRSINTILHFKKNLPIQFSLIKVETEGLMHSINDSVISKLKKTFLTKQSNFIHQGIQNLNIAKKLTQFHSITEPGMMGHVMKKEIIQSILTMEIEDNTDNLIKISRAIKRSTLNQINEFKKIPRFIKQYAVEAMYSKNTTS